MKLNLIVFLSLIYLTSTVYCKSDQENDEFSLFDQIHSSPVLPTMIQYVVVPAVQAHGSDYISNKTRELTDSVSRWQNVIQNWAAHLSSVFEKLTQIRFDSCTRKLLCSLGKAKYQSMREQKRSTGSKIIEALNSVFRLPLIEQKLNHTYLEARDFGLSGGNCELYSLSKQCPIPSSNFDQLFYIIKQLF